MSEEIIESALKDLPGTLYYPKFHLMTWHPMGVFDAALADKLREFIEWEEPVQDAPFNRYTDVSGVTQVDISLAAFVRGSLPTTESIAIG